ncbi:hypothetical protein ABW19_dt0205805 [Dactylella cylindrospora]|nr:hypothetical protein ABW19_dt0205805 [Dactylella cylindrospora]
MLVRDLVEGMIDAKAQNLEFEFDGKCSVNQMKKILEFVINISETARSASERDQRVQLQSKRESVSTSPKRNTSPLPVARTRYCGPPTPFTSYFDDCDRPRPLNSKAYQKVDNIRISDLWNVCYNRLHRDQRGFVSNSGEGNWVNFLRSEGFELVGDIGGWGPYRFKTLIIHENILKHLSPELAGTDKVKQEIQKITCGDKDRALEITETRGSEPPYRTLKRKLTQAKQTFLQSHAHQNCEIQVDNTDPETEEVESSGTIGVEDIQDLAGIPIARASIEETPAGRKTEARSQMSNPSNPPFIPARFTPAQEEIDIGAYEVKLESLSKMTEKLQADSANRQRSISDVLNVVVRLKGIVDDLIAKRSELLAPSQSRECCRKVQEEVKELKEMVTENTAMTKILSTKLDMMIKEVLKWDGEGKQALAGGDEMEVG